MAPDAVALFDGRGFRETLDGLERFLELVWLE